MRLPFSLVSLILSPGSSIGSLRNSFLSRLLPNLVSLPVVVSVVTEEPG